MDDYSHQMPEIKSKFFIVKTVFPYEDGEVRTGPELKSWALSHNKCCGLYLGAGINWYLEFTEEKSPSNLRVLLSHIDNICVKRITEEFFKKAIEDPSTKNLIEKRGIPIIKESNVRTYDYKTVHTNNETYNNKPIGTNDEFYLTTFKMDIQVKNLKQVQGMVKQISFNNPEHKTIELHLAIGLYKKTTDTFIDFYVDPNNLSTSLTPAQFSNLVARGVADKETKKIFPEFCDGNVLNHYLNFARHDTIELIGLEPDEFVTLDCYTIIRKHGIFEGPHWVTYSFSF
jgi:hypothetical protein